MTCKLILIQIIPQNPRFYILYYEIKKTTEHEQVLDIYVFFFIFGRKHFVFLFAALVFKCSILMPVLLQEAVYSVPGTTPTFVLHSPTRQDFKIKQAHP